VGRTHALRRGEPQAGRLRRAGLGPDLAKPGQTWLSRARLGKRRPDLVPQTSAQHAIPSKPHASCADHTRPAGVPRAHLAIGSGNRARPRLSPTMVRASSIIRIRPIIRVLARGRAATRSFSVARPLDGRACCARPCLAHAETAGVAPWCATVARQAAGAPAGGLETTGISSRHTPL